MDEQTEKLLREVIELAFTSRCEWLALVQMLIDEKILKGTEDEVLGELTARAKDLLTDEMREAKINDRARAIREAWSKLPKQ